MNANSTVTTRWSCNVAPIERRVTTFDSEANRVKPTQRSLAAYEVYWMLEVSTTEGGSEEDGARRP